MDMRGLNSLKLLSLGQKNARIGKTFCSMGVINVFRSQEGWYRQPKYCYKKQYTLF